MGERDAVRARLSALETGFLFLGEGQTSLLVGSLLVLAGPAPSHDELRLALARALADTPQLRWRVRRWPLDLRRPEWAPDESFRLEDHLHHITVDAVDDAGLRALVPRLMAVAPDLRRAPWQMWHVSGPDGGRWALVVQAHHSLVDGVSGEGLVLSLLGGADASPTPTPRPVPGRARRLSTGDRLRLARRGLGAVIHRDLPPCALSGEIGPEWSWGWVTRDLGSLERTAAAHGCTVNDVLLAALTGAYRTFLAARGDDVEHLVVRAIIPVSQRGASAGHVGTLASAMFVELPIDVAGRAERLAAVRARTVGQKSASVADGTEAVLELADLVPTVVLAPAARAYARRGQRRVNLAVSNVRGPREPRTLLGRPLLELVPFTPLALSVRTTVAMASQGGRVSIGVTGDTAALPDFGVLLAAVATSLDDLIGLQ